MTTQALLAYCVSKVSPEDIKKFVLGDPGYHDYVRVWSEILSLERVPSSEECSFEINEVIGACTDWYPESETPPQAFHRFRCLTRAVLLVLLSREDHESARQSFGACLYLLCEDQLHLGDALLAEKIGAAARAAGMSRKSFACDGLYPLGMLVELLLRLRYGARPEDLDDAATELIEEEAHARKIFNEYDPVFLLGSLSRSERRRWRALVEDLIPSDPGDSLLSLVRSELLKADP